MFKRLFCKIPVSVVVIAYNREQYIKDCMDSILAQELEMQIICVDDCSSDHTYDILCEYAASHSNITVIRNPENRGTVYTRYIGLSACKGEYALQVDADDRLIEGTLSCLYKQAKAQNADILEFGCRTDGNKMYNTVSGVYDENLLEHFSKRKIRNTLVNKLVSRNVYRAALDMIDPDVNQANFSDCIFYMYHFLKNARRLVAVDTFGYFYYTKRGMTSTISDVEVLKQYALFPVTRHELEKAYGHIPELKFTWNYVCNQAVALYVTLPLEEQEKYAYLLYQLMSKENADYLIKEKRKSIQ